MPTVDRTDIRITFWLCLGAGLTVSPFVVLQLWAGNLLLASLATLASVLLLSLGYHTWRRGRVPVYGVAAVAVIGAIVVFGAAHIQEYVGVLWVFPFIAFSYALLGTRLASALCLLFFPAVLWSISSWAGAYELPRLVATIALSWLITYVFSFNIERQRRELGQLALRDPLTGVANRREMEIELRHAHHLRERYATVACVVMFDLDHFKSINDSYGHDVGDRILVELARLIESRLRRSDRLFRYGGEEFLLLLPETTQNDAVLLAEELCELSKEKLRAGEQAVTLSAGVAEVSSAEPIETWLKRADEALYSAKQAGRDRVCAARP